MSRVPGGSRVTSRPSMKTVPASGRSRPVTSRSVVVLPAPLGPKRTTNSPSLTASERSRTASTWPKRLLMCRSETLAMGFALLANGWPARRLNGHSGLRVEQAQGTEAERETYRLADLHRHARRQPRLDRTLLGHDGDDLGRSQILGAENAAAQRRCVREPDVLRANAQHQRTALRPLADFRNGNADVLELHRVGVRVEAGIAMQEIHRRRADEVGDEHAGR